ncbi:hypothetical protein RCF19_29975 [Rhodococcus qingshengii]
MTVDPRMHPVTEMLHASARKAVAVNRDVNCLRMAVTELAKIVETLLPEPDPEPTPEDLAAMEATGVESFKGARAKLFGVPVTAAEFEDLQERYTARISAKNKHIGTLENRIANQRKELDHLNSGRSLRNKELEARIEELELLAKAPATAIDQLREELSGQLLGFFQKSA